MLIYKNFSKSILHIFFVINLFFFSTLQAKNIDRFNNADNISNYFSGILLLNQNKYKESFKHLMKLEGLEKSHEAYSSKYLYTLINSGNFYQAFKYSKNLEKIKKDTFESDIIVGIYHLKNFNNTLSKKYFLKAKKRSSNSILNHFIASTIYIWSDLKEDEFEKAKLELNKLDERFQNLKKIQNVLLNCYYNKEETSVLFRNLINDEKTDYSRYNYFFAKFLNKIGEKDKAKKIIESSHNKYPKNILIKQLKIDLINNKKNFKFNCNDENHVIAEFLYIAANALSSQSIYPLSNFYLNLSKYLNENFQAFDILKAENFYNSGDFLAAKKIYRRLRSHGDAFKWFSDKQISRILVFEKDKKNSLRLLKKSFEEIQIRDIYQIYDYAEFLKNNEEFEESIKYYSQILQKIDIKHPLYPDVTDGRGVAYERIGNWDKAERDLLNSLEASPNQAYVINYLAYSWIEQGVKIQQSLEMLKKANSIKLNDPYIIDSLGWALFKLKRYSESKNYLQTAVRLMPADPVVNDHYGDVLWKNGKKLQARYYWNYVLKLEKTEENLKKVIEQKLIKGL